jgi:hypothetical protein
MLNSYKRSQDILDEPKNESTLTKILNYRKKCVCHIEKMQTSRLPNIRMKYRPSETRNKR